jgi:hypothetical protein
MSDPLDVHRNLEQCMQTIQAGREAMAHDMRTRPCGWALPR